MSPDQVLRDIESRGLSISAAGTELRLRGPKERIDPDLVNRIKEVKPALIEFLSQPDPPPAEGFGLTGLQRGYLLGRTPGLEIGNVASHVYHEIEGCWDLDRLTAALHAVLRRHDALRTRFTPAGTQTTDLSAELPVGRQDLRDLDGDSQQARRTESRRQRCHRMLPAETGPLLAVDVTILADDRMVLHVSHDGLVMDGISMFLFFRDWWAHYAGEDPPQRPRPDNISFESYVDTLAADRAKSPARRAKAYWLNRLDGLAGHPDLPLRTSPASIQRPVFSQRQVRLGAPEWTALKERAAVDGLTPSGLLLAAYAETLAYWGAGDRFTLNTTVANRPPIQPAIFDAVGQFSDTMLVEIELDHRVGFRQRAVAIRDRLRVDLDNRHFSGLEVLRELRNRPGRADARMPFTFNSAIGYPRAGVDGSALELFGPEVYSVSQTPQVWLNAFAMEQHGGIVVQLDGVHELFPAGLLDDLAAGYQRLLRLLLAESAWSARTFDLLPAGQRARRAAANDTATAMPQAPLRDQLLAQAARTPEATAIITDRRDLTYRELHERAARVAGWLRAGGIGRDDLVGLVMTRGPEQVIGILGTILAGAAYLPVDAGLPAARQDYLLRDGRVRRVLTNAHWSDQTGIGCEVLNLDAHSALSGDPVPVGPTPAGANPDDLAYVLYTSGTTGTPKGVMISQGSVANVVADCVTRFRIDQRDRLFGISAFNFDLSVFDVFGALSTGAAVVLPDHGRAADPAHWLALCERAGVTVWNSVPAIVALLREQAVAEWPAGPGKLATLRLVMMSGDRIPPALPATLRETWPDLSVSSLGGPTETTVWNIQHPIDPAERGTESIPYGRPNSNNRAYVLGRDGQDAPDWVTGEICAAGAGLARGYWGDPERTAARFYTDERLGERIYRTGDLGRYLPDGSIAILGRSDFQIKVNGYRIEAGEVETRLIAVAGVRQAVVTRQEGAHGDRLAAHLAPTDPSGARPSDAELRSALREHLPEYMIPSLVAWHEQLPLTRNGKVDRSALAELLTSGAAADRPVPHGDEALATGTEQIVAGLWAEVLRVGDVAATVRLADLGGDSLAAARILAGVRKRYGVTIPLHRLPEVETVRAMADRINHLTANASNTSEVAS